MFNPSFMKTPPNVVGHAYHASDTGGAGTLRSGCQAAWARVVSSVARKLTRRWTSVTTVSGVTDAGTLSTTASWPG